MRDPEGELRFEKNSVFRIVNSESSSLLFLRNKLFQEIDWLRNKASSENGAHRRVVYNN